MRFDMNMGLKLYSGLGFLVKGEDTHFARASWL